MMLRPRDSHDQRVLEASLEISPEPTSLRFVQDAFGNHVGSRDFRGVRRNCRSRASCASEHSPQHLDVDAAARIFPVHYDADELPDLAHWIERHYPDPEDEVGRWAHQFLPASGSTKLWQFSPGSPRASGTAFFYRRRETKGIQPPTETLRLGHGCCRDFAVLMIEATRSLGLAARFSSGYMTVPFDETARGATHAWAQIYLPANRLDRFRPDQRQRRQDRPSHRSP